MTFELNINNKYYNFKTNLIGKFNLYNLNAVIKFLSYINIDINKIINTIESLIPPKGRVDIINYNTNKIIIDYAHTPDAIEKIINTNGSSFTKPWFGQLMTGPQVMAYLIQLDTWLNEYNVKLDI